MRDSDFEKMSSVPIHSFDCIFLEIFDGDKLVAYECLQDDPDFIEGEKEVSISLLEDLNLKNRGSECQREMGDEASG